MRSHDLAALALAATLSACGQPASRPSDELTALNERFEEAFNTGDVDALAALWAEDARFLPGGFEPLQGRETITAVFSEFMEAGSKLELETIEAVVASDIGYQVGTYSGVGEHGQALDGKFVETWRQIDGEWKITNLILNSNAPEELVIPTLLVTQEVTDAAGWLAAWQGSDGRHELFARHGAPGVRIFQSLEDPSLTGLLLFIDDMEALQAFLDSPEAEAARAEDGVVDATLRVFTEVQ